MPPMCFHIAQNPRTARTQIQIKKLDPVPLSAGLLGPTLRAEEGETIVVTFRNMAYGAYSIHPHGVAYGKQSEGELGINQDTQR